MDLCGRTPAKNCSSWVASLRNPKNGMPRSLWIGTSRNTKNTNRFKELWRISIQRTRIIPNCGRETLLQLDFSGWSLMMGPQILWLLQGITVMGNHWLASQTFHLFRKKGTCCRCQGITPGLSHSTQMTTNMVDREFHQQIFKRSKVNIKGYQRTQS